MSTPQHEEYSIQRGSGFTAVNAPKADDDTSSINSEHKRRSTKIVATNVMDIGYERYESDDPVDPQDSTTYPATTTCLPPACADSKCHGVTKINRCISKMIAA